MLDEAVVRQLLEKEVDPNSRNHLESEHVSPSRRFLHLSMKGWYNLCRIESFELYPYIILFVVQVLRCLDNVVATELRSLRLRLSYRSHSYCLRDVSHCSGEMNGLGL
jgi:hypothetical protein